MEVDFGSWLQMEVHYLKSHILYEGREKMAGGLR